jgi:integrase
MSSSVVDLSQHRGEMRPTPTGVLPPLRALRLLDQLRERIRYLHYSRSTEDIYVYWPRAFIRFHGLRHPREMGGAEVEAFLTWLADERQVASATHKQALSALLFLYTKVLELSLPWVDQIERPRVRRRLPVVLSREEVSAVLGGMAGELGLLARLIDGTGMRINEALQLRVKDVDFAHRALIVRRQGLQGSRPDAAPGTGSAASRAARKLTQILDRGRGHRDGWRRDATRPGSEVPARRPSGFRRRRRFFDQRGVLLRHLVELGDRRLTWPMPSLCSDAAAVISPMMSVTRCTLSRRSRSSCGRRRPPGASRLRPSRPGADQALDLLGGLRRALGQAAHFAGHHREAAALFAGTRRFHRGVQRQDVGLEGDAVDHADDVGDLLRAVLISSMVVTTCATTAPPRAATSAADEASWLAWRAESALCARCRSAAPSRGGLLQVGGGLLGAGCDRSVVAGGDLGAAALSSARRIRRRVRC